MKPDPYKLFHGDVFISFGVITKTDRKTNRRTKSQTSIKNIATERHNLCDGGNSTEQHTALPVILEVSDGCIKIYGSMGNTICRCVQGQLILKL